MSKKHAPAAGRQSPAEALLTLAASFLALDTLMPGRPLTSAARWIRRTAAEAAEDFHDRLHDNPMPGEDLTTPEGELHKQG